MFWINLACVGALYRPAVGYVLISCTIRPFAQSPRR